MLQAMRRNRPIDETLTIGETEFKVYSSDYQFNAWTIMRLSSTMINSTSTSRLKLLRLLALCMSLLLSSCSLLSWFDSKKGYDDDEYINWTAQHFYQEAKKELMDGNYDKSVKLYEKLEARYPFDKLAT